jgi:hypothetical protein
VRVPDPFVPSGEGERELLRRLVQVIEQREQAEEAERQSKEIERERERRSLFAILSALVAFVWLIGVQRDPIGHFLTTYAATLPVVLPILGIVLAILYRAFRLHVLDEWIVYWAAIMALVLSAYYLLPSRDGGYRVAGVIAVLAALYYYWQLIAGTRGEPSAVRQMLGQFMKTNSGRVLIVLIFLVGVGVTAWWVGLADVTLGIILVLVVIAGLGYLVVIARRRATTRKEKTSFTEVLSTPPPGSTALPLSSPPSSRSTSQP